MELLIKVNKKKQGRKQKCKEWYYREKEDADVAHKYVQLFCDTNQFPSLNCFGPYTKPHVVRGLIKHYHMRFDQILRHIICAIHLIPCSCAEYTPMLEKPWIPGLPPHQQPR